MTGPGGSPAERMAFAIASLPGNPARVLEAALECLTVVELAAVALDWRDFWARPEQLPPDDPGWRSWGACTGRGWGKTVSRGQFVHEEAIAGRAMRIALIAQNADKTYDVMVAGESGLLELAPPWERPVFERGRVLWPNGAQAFLFTPERPGDIRGPGVNLSWCSEFVAWPVHRREEAWMNVRLMTRLGYARVIWDTTPKRRHPIIRELLERSRRAPRQHVVVGGSTRENVANLAPEALAEWEEKYGGTMQGREELEGEFIDDEEGALFRIEWINNHRRPMPERLKRRAIAVDPAISTRKGTDATGIVEGGLGLDDQLLIVEDLTGRFGWEVWGGIVVERYVRHELDCVVVERNRGGDAVAANLRTCGRERGLVVEVVDAKARTRHVPGTIYVKEVLARAAKESRAEPVAALYERGRVSHVLGADLLELEEQMVTWDPLDRGPSPNNMDAAMWVLWELGGLAFTVPDLRQGFVGLEAARARLKEGARRPVTVGSLLARKGRRSSRI